MNNFVEERTLVDIILRSNPLGLDIPREIKEKTQSVQIIRIGIDHIVIGSQNLIDVTVIPLDEISLVSISLDANQSETSIVSEKDYFEWERDFAQKIESAGDGTVVRRKLDGVSELTSRNFHRTLENADYAILDVYATWCQPCKEVAAVVKELSNKYGEKVLFAKIDGDRYEAIGDELSITSYPTVVLLKKGEEFKRIEGARSIDYFADKIEVMIGAKKHEPLRNKFADGKVHEMLGDELVETAEKSPASVIVFYEKGDYESQLQTRVLHDLSKVHKRKVFFAKVDIDAEKELVEMFDIEGAPEIIFISEGQMVGYSEERLTKSEFSDAIVEFLSKIV